MERILRLVDEGSLPSGVFVRVFCLLGIPPLLVASQLRGLEGLDTALVCLYGPANAGKSFLQLLIIGLLGSKKKLNLTNSTLAGVCGHLRHEGEHTYVALEELGSQAPGSDARKTGGVSADIVELASSAKGGKLTASGMLFTPQAFVFSSNAVNYAPPGAPAGSACCEATNSRVLPIRLDGPAEGEAGLALLRVLNLVGVVIAVTFKRTRPYHLRPSPNRRIVLANIDTSSSS
jgi:hypothetical protein